MTLLSVLYISRSAIAPADAKAVVGEIVATARGRNPALGLTGALLFTGTHFAQVLEGEEEAVDGIMRGLRADSRHDGLLVVNRGAVTERRFADWSMAYCGPSQFVSRHVTRLLSDPALAEQRRAAEWLTDLLCEFSQGNGPTS